MALHSSIKGFSGNAEDTIVSSAKSTSIISDDGPHYNSFSDMDLRFILKQVFQKYDQPKLTSAIQPRLTQSYYSVQNGENAYQYKNRLASKKSKELFPHTTQIFINTFND